MGALNPIYGSVIKGAGVKVNSLIYKDTNKDQFQQLLLLQGCLKIKGLGSLWQQLEIKQSKKNW